MPKSAHHDLNLIDRMIKAGKSDAAKKAVNEQARKKMDRDELVVFSSLARRAGLPLLGLQLLKPLVRNPSKSPIEANAEEKMQYAACLISIGALGEARALLETIDEGRHPQVHLFRAFALVNQRDYQAAIPLFLNFLKADKRDSYSRLIAKVNLAEACVAEGDFKRADPILHELLFKSSVQKLNLLLGKALEVAAMSFIFQKKFDTAEKFLEKAERFLKVSEFRLEYHVRKWKAILDLQCQRDKASGLRRLHALRREGVALGHWESVRLCDRFEAIARRDKRLLWHVYFGTPNDSFRNQLLHDFGGTNPIPKTFQWNPMGTDLPIAGINLTERMASPEVGKLKFGRVIARLFILLSSDFYASFSIATLYASLHPGDFYNPLTSPSRVHTALRRLRTWARANSLPILISEQNGFYRMTATAPCTLTVGRRSPEDETLSPKIAKIREVLGLAYFSSDKLSRALGMSYRSTQRFLNRAVRYGLIERDGGGKCTRYRLASSG